MENGVSFSYETVMSHPNKVSFLQSARRKGYKIYVYFIATEDPEINKSRVRVRMAQNGHAVDPDVIERRYYKSLQHLKPAVRVSDKAYLWDNSGNSSKLIAEVTNGTDVSLIDTNNIPNWFVKYLAT
jgi:predicted ABC-type ATPase